MNTVMLNNYNQLPLVPPLIIKPPKMIIKAYKRGPMSDKTFKQLLLDVEQNGNPEIELIVEFNNRLKGIQWNKSTNPTQPANGPR